MSLRDLANENRRQLDVLSSVAGMTLTAARLLLSDWANDVRRAGGNAEVEYTESASRASQLRLTANGRSTCARWDADMPTTLHVSACGPLGILGRNEDKRIGLDPHDIKTIAEQVALRMVARMDDLNVG